MLRARAEMPGDKDDCVACPCRLQTRWGRDGGRSGARAPPIPPPRQHDGSALTGISPSVRTRDNPPRCASASPFWYFLLESHGICLDGKKHVSLVVFGFRFQVFSKEKCKACSFVKQYFLFILIFGAFKNEFKNRGAQNYGFSSLGARSDQCHEWEWDIWETVPAWLGQRYIAY